MITNYFLIEKSSEKKEADLRWSSSMVFKECVKITVSGSNQDSLEKSCWFWKKCLCGKKLYIHVFLRSNFDLHSKKINVFFSFLDKGTWKGYKLENS